MAPFAAAAAASPAPPAPAAPSASAVSSALAVLASLTTRSLVGPGHSLPGCWLIVRRCTRGCGVCVRVHCELAIR